MQDAEDDEVEFGPRTPSPVPVSLPPTPPEIARSRERRETAHMRYQDALGRLAVAIQQVSEAQVAEKGDHEAVETKPKAEEQEKIDIRPRGPSDRLGGRSRNRGIMPRRGGKTSSR